MSSDSVASFWNFARRNQFMPLDRVEALATADTSPRENLSGLCDHLVSQGVLTDYQADQIRAGRRHDLRYAGVTILGEVGPCPGGRAYRAMHPSLGTEVELRKLDASLLQPSDTTTDFVARGQSAATLAHPNLASVLDVGLHEGELYATLPAPRGETLANLVREIGAMPIALAREFVRQSADAMATAHAKGVAHGDLRPAHLSVAPLVQSSRAKRDGTPLIRPAADATVHITECGLIPLRPTLSDWATTSPAPSIDELVYLAPERDHDQTPTPAGDVYSLGAIMVYLLTARPLFSAERTEIVVTQIVNLQRPALSVLRPDLPRELAELTLRMLAPDPAARPTMAEVAMLLQPAAPISLSVAPIVLQPAMSQSQSIAEDVELLTPDSPQNLWVPQPYISTGDSHVLPMVLPEYAPPTILEAEGVEPEFAPIMSEFSTTADDADHTPRPKRVGVTADDKQRARRWIMIGLGLQVAAIPLWIVLLYQQGCIGAKEPSTPVKKSRR